MKPAPVMSIVLAGSAVAASLVSSLNCLILVLYNNVTWLQRMESPSFDDWFSAILMAASTALLFFVYYMIVFFICTQTIGRVLWSLMRWLKLRHWPFFVSVGAIVSGLGVLMISPDATGFQIATAIGGGAAGWFIWAQDRHMN